jgi:parallel beta-helix repeat protein
MKKTIVLGIIFLLVVMNFTSISSIQFNKNITIQSDRDDILYVGGNGPGNYSKIQDAIDNASDGDTVFVYDDSSPYEENLIVNKSIKLIGENRNTTYINGSYYGNIIYISVNCTTITGFTIQNIKAVGIFINSNHNTITGNNIIDHNPRGYSRRGIYLNYSDGNTISDNKISLNSYEAFFISGVFLLSSNNNIIVGNNISNNKGDYYGYGIYVSNSRNNTITGNKISENFDGIKTYNSTNGNIFDNIFFSNGEGIFIHSSNNNEISNNSFFDNGGGIYLYRAYNINIFNNSFFKDGLYVLYSEDNNVENNTVNGKPLVYLEDKSDKVVIEAGQVILVNCDNITVINQNLSDTTIGVQLWKTNNSKICHNYYSNVMYGIHSSYSHNNNLSNSNFSNNYTSIYLSNSNKTTINCNTILNGGHYSTIIYILESSNNTIYNNRISGKYNGIYLSYCKNHTVIKNKINLNNDFKPLVIHGIYLWHCDNNIISDNIICTNFSQGTGILITHSNNNFISINKISKIGNHGDYGWGIKTISSDSNTVILNDITKTCGGIYITYYSFENIIIANNIKENRCDGIKLKQSSNNSISNNMITKNLIGIILNPFSHNNIIYHNNFINNTQNAYDEGKNIWDDGYPSGGNYWDDYNGTDNDGDGIGDTPYLIPGGDNVDRYPLMEPYGNHPPNTPTINGPISGKPNTEYNFTFNAIDPEGEAVMYIIDWGDNNTERTEYVESGIEILLNHTWNETGTYLIRAKAIDIHGAESDWEEFTVTIPRDKASSNLLLKKFEFNSHDYDYKNYLGIS